MYQVYESVQKSAPDARRKYVGALRDKCRKDKELHSKDVFSP